MENIKTPKMSSALPCHPVAFMRHKKMSVCFHDFAKAEYASENTMFIEAKLKKVSNEGMYKFFIKRGAPKEVNISAKMRNNLVALAEPKSIDPNSTAEPDFNHADWDKHLNTVYGEVVTLLRQNMMYRFLNSEQFTAFVRMTSTKTVDQAIAILKNHNYIKFKSPVGKKLIEDLMRLWALGDKNGAKKRLKSDTKALGLLKDDPDVILKILQDENVIAKR